MPDQFLRRVIAQREAEQAEAMANAGASLPHDNGRPGKPMTKPFSAEDVDEEEPRKGVLTPAPQCDVCGKSLATHNSSGRCSTCRINGRRPTEESAQEAEETQPPHFGARNDFMHVARALGEDPADIIDRWCFEWLEELRHAHAARKGELR